MTENFTEEQQALDELENALKARREAFFKLGKKLANYKRIEPIDLVISEFEKAEERWERASANVEKIAEELRKGLRK